LRETPSNRDAAQGGPAIAAACRQAAVATSPFAALRAVLLAAVEAAGAERGFVVAFLDPGDPSMHRIEARVRLRPDVPLTPSRSVLRWVASTDGPPTGADATLPADVLDAQSVRSLELRHVLAARLPGRPTRALLVDGRQAPTVPPARDVPLLDAFAALAAIVGPPAPRQEPASIADVPPLVGAAPAFTALLEDVRRVADWQLPVLVTGESGTGKEVIARALHAEGRRGAGPFVAINCAAVPEALLESELFGAVRGANTGAERDRPGLFRLATGGTLFLDEIGDMPPAMQAKLLRVLQERRSRPVGGSTEVPVDARVVAATHHDLARLVARSRFRDDLYYRLAVVELRVPALRERRDDIPALVLHTARRLEVETGVAPIVVSPCAMDRLSRHAWPGNVRELQAALAQALVRARGQEIRAEHLELGRRDADAARALRAGLEHEMIGEALRDAGGNLTLAAAQVGWSRQKLYRRIRQLGVERQGAPVNPP
jgi:MoxR-like ATPase